MKHTAYLFLILFGSLALAAQTPSTQPSPVNQIFQFMQSGTS